MEDDDEAFIAAAERTEVADEYDEQPPDDLDSPIASTSTSTVTPTPTLVSSAVPPPPPPPRLLKQSTLSFHQRQPSDYLPELNHAQRSAVTADLGSLQILAGPGSGKTKVLTARVAYLVQHYKIEPNNLVVVTFTNKAANEMKHRLSLLVGAETVGNLIMGTFHSVCVRYLRRYGKRIGIKNDFTVADRDDCLAIAKRAIRSSQVPEDLSKELKPNYILDVVSKCKATGLSPRAYRDSADSADYFKAREKVDAVADIYQHYEDELARDNALDFDDLLVRGLELVTKYPSIVSSVQSVLIDEFQDTNACQYDLVKVIARASHSLTIVGDPDQSIYGWRNAEVENLERMMQDFGSVQQIFLEENYRSTGAILGAALAVVKQDTKRIQKGLKAMHGAGSSVVLHCAPNAFEEAAFIAAQIKHLVAHTGHLVDYGDVAILLRYGALSRNIEVALQKAGIPSRMVGGHKFFDRAEVKDMISYLQLVDNPSYTAAFVRVVNVPLRGIGEKTIRDILATAKANNMSAFELSYRLANGSGKVGLTTKQKAGLRGFVELIRNLKRRAEEGTPVPDLIDLLTTHINYQAHLEKSQGPDAKDRWENVEELKAFAAVVAEENPEGVEEIALPEDDVFEEIEIPATTTQVDGSEDDDDIIFVEPLMEAKAKPVVAGGMTTDNLLRTFLAVSMLATDSETSDVKADSKQRKVTISTCHAAKGLEWPIVFVPACEDGTYPFYRSTTEEEVAEERRLLYVAITRAQGFCTLTHSQQRMAGADMKNKDISPFLRTVAQTYPTLFVPKLQKITRETRKSMAKVLGREAPDEEETAKLIEAHAKTLPIADPRASSGTFSPFGGYAAQMNRYSSGTNSSYSSNNRPSMTPGPASIPAGASAGFNSALSTLRGGSATTGRGGTHPPKISKPLPTTNIVRSSSTTPMTTTTSGAFKPPRPMRPPPPSSSAPASVEGGHFEPPETRSSLISNAVLVGTDAEWKERSVPKDLVERFEKGEGKRLDELKSLGLKGAARPAVRGEHELGAKKRKKD